MGPRLFLKYLPVLSLPSPGVSKHLNKDFIQSELIGSLASGVEDASLNVSSAAEGRKVVLLAPFMSGDQLSPLAGSVLLLEFV